MMMKMTIGSMSNWTFPEIEEDEKPYRLLCTLSIQKQNRNW